MRLQKKFTSKDGKSSITIEVDFTDEGIKDVWVDFDQYKLDETKEFLVGHHIYPPVDISDMFEVEPFLSIVDNIEWAQMALELQSEKNCEQ